MMKHLLMDPRFPDIVGERSFFESPVGAADFGHCANDNGDEVASDLADPLFLMMARREIAATRLW